MKTCFLHIGTEKTGSTALQNWLYENIDKLDKHGVYLSRLLGQPNNRLFPMYFTTSLDDWAQAQNLNSLEKKSTHFRGFEEGLRKELQLALINNDKVIISSEHLHSRITTEAEIIKIKEFLDTIFERTVVICYFRKQADMALSLYSTSLKFGHTTRLSAFMDKVTENNYYYNFEKIAENWSNVFQRENCIFRIYDRQLLQDNDIRRDFLNAIEVSPIDDFKFKALGSNESLSHTSAIIFEAINRIFPCLPDRQTLARKLTRVVNKILKRFVKKLFSHSKNKIIYHDADVIMTRFKTSNTRFFQRYFNDFRPF